MPKFLEDKLKAEAAAKGFTGERADHYVFGALNNRGLMHGSKVTAKGEALQAKHDRDERAGTAADQRPSAHVRSSASTPKPARRMHGDGPKGQHYSGH